LLQGSLRFEVEVVEVQRHLNGTRYVSIEGDEEGASGGWAIALNYGRPKDEESSLEEADLALTGPRGSLFAGLESGRTDIVTDDVGGDDRELLELTMRVHGGDGDFADAAGEIRLQGEIMAAAGRLDVIISLDAGRD